MTLRGFVQLAAAKNIFTCPERRILSDRKYRRLNTYVPLLFYPAAAFLEFFEISYSLSGDWYFYHYYSLQHIASFWTRTTK